jgi:hypothetical protein
MKKTIGTVLLVMLAAGCAMQTQGTVSAMVRDGGPLRVAVDLAEIVTP